MNLRAFILFVTVFSTGVVWGGVLEVLSQGSHYLSKGGCAKIDDTKIDQALKQAARTCGHNKPWPALREVSRYAQGNAEDRLFALLASQHASELTCSAAFADQMAKGSPHETEIIDRLKTLRAAKQALVQATNRLAQDPSITPQICPSNLESIRPNPLIVANRGSDPYVELCREVVINRTAVQAISASIPLSQAPAVNGLIQKYANLGEGPELERLESNLSADLRAAYRNDTEILRDESSNLRKKAARGGDAFDRASRGALLSDPAVIEHVIAAGGAPLRELACRADARYGSGAEALSMNLTTGSLLVSGGTALVVRAGTAGARVVAGATSLRSSGLISAGAFRTLLLSAPAFTLDGLATWDDLSRACGDPKPSLRATGTDGQSCVSAPALEEIGRESCLLNASLNAIGFTVALTPLARAALKRKEGRLSQPQRNSPRPTRETIALDSSSVESQLLERAQKLAPTQKADLKALLEEARDPRSGEFRLSVAQQAELERMRGTPIEESAVAVNEKGRTLNEVREYQVMEYLLRRMPGYEKMSAAEREATIQKFLAECK